jgi:hypothetical protein
MACDRADSTDIVKREISSLLQKAGNRVATINLLTVATRALWGTRAPSPRGTPQSNGVESTAAWQAWLTLSIWMNETLRCRYAALPSQSVPANRKPIGRMHLGGDAVSGALRLRGGLSCAATAAHRRYVSVLTLTASHKPVLTQSHARAEQNPMCRQVRAMGKGNPEYDKMYLLSRMTLADSEIHSNIYPYVASTWLTAGF